MPGYSENGAHQSKGTYIMRDKLLEAILSAGATKAAFITQEQIVLSAEFRKPCESNQCGMYGRCWMCPPAIGEIEPLMEKVRSYPTGLLYQTIGELEDSFDIEGMFEAKKIHAQVSQTFEVMVKEQMPGMYLHLTCGGCYLCDTCAITQNKPCRFPEKALSSLEGYGVDVYNTVKDTPLKYINGQNTVTYFGLVLFEE